MMKLFYTIATLALFIVPLRAADTLTIVVMDPLAKPLACDCVKGYAQRRYDMLGKYLQQKLGRPVKVVFAEALGTALKKTPDQHADLVIGKHSVVLSDAKLCKVALEPLAGLTGMDGKTTQTGLLVVPALDPAVTVADLKGYRILFGPPDCDEKCKAPIELLKKFGVAVPAKREFVPSCSTAAGKVLEFGDKVRAVAVISSYAKPLLEGCGTIEKGDLRIVGESAPVPFITVFANGKCPAAERASIFDALSRVKQDKELLKLMESKNGFVSFEPKKKR